MVKPGNLLSNVSRHPCGSGIHELSSNLLYLLACWAKAIGIMPSLTRIPDPVTTGCVPAYSQPEGSSHPIHTPGDLWVVSHRGGSSCPKITSHHVPICEWGWVHPTSKASL